MRPLERAGAAALLGLVLVTSTACLGSGAGRASSGERSPEPRPPAVSLEGVWGAPGVRLTLEGKTGTLEFDCGGATIEKLVVSPSQRRFRATGAIHAAVAGPAVYPPPPGREPRPARFRGRFKGDRLRLVVVREKPRLEGEARKSVHLLAQGDPGQLRLCR